MKRAPVQGNGTPAAPKVRRGYFECRFGQLHVLNAMPPGGGFDEATTLICLHSTSRPAGTFRGLLEGLGKDRSVYAPDLPGFGDSDPPPARPAVADYAAAMSDFLDLMRFRQIDVLGVQLGAAVAVELALAKRDAVRRLILIGAPLLAEAEREGWRRAAAIAAPTEDGSHLIAEWRRVLETREEGSTLDAIAQRFAERLHTAPHAAAAVNAVAQYAMRERLAAVTQPVLVLRPKDELWDVTQRAREVLPRARVLDLPAHGSGLIDGAPQVVVDAASEFLKN